MTLKDGERLRFGYLFLFLGALPCTEWLDDTVVRDDNVLIITGSAAGAERLVETYAPGILAGRRSQVGCCGVTVELVGRGMGRLTPA